MLVKINFNQAECVPFPPVAFAPSISRDKPANERAFTGGHLERFLPFERMFVIKFSFPFTKRRNGTLRVTLINIASNWIGPFDVSLHSSRSARNWIRRAPIWFLIVQDALPGGLAALASSPPLPSGDLLHRRGNRASSSAIVDDFQGGLYARIPSPEALDAVYRRPCSCASIRHHARSSFANSGKFTKFKCKIGRCSAGSMEARARRRWNGRRE